MQARLSSPRSKRLGALVLGIGLGALALAQARADNAVVPDLPVAAALRGTLASGYRLEVYINGRDRKLIAEFHRGADGAFSAKRSELQEAGLIPPVGLPGAEIALDSLLGLSFRYDEAGQAIYFTAPDSLVAPSVYNAAARDTYGAVATSDLGAALNYDLYTTSGEWSPLGRIAAPGQSASLDARIFSPLGVLRQTGIVGATALRLDTKLRLETSWQYQDETHDLTARVGDTITSGLSWTRPIRIGGFQIAHDYETRPDLVTAATPTLNGSAAVPTTVDVYVNNVKIFEQNVQSGPFQIDNLPAINGGDATVKLLDAAGKQVSQTLAFFANPDALRPGVFEFSAEGGRPRLNYAVLSNDYGREYVGSGTARYGLTRFVTFEAHGEGGAGLVNGGGGVLFNAFDRASFDFALAGARSQSGSGIQIAATARTAFMGLLFEASTQRTYRQYQDLASVTAPTASAVAADVTALIGPYYLTTSTLPPKALDRFSVTAPNFFNHMNFGASFVNLVEPDGTRSRIVGANISKNLPHSVSVNASAYFDVANHHDAGVFAGINVQLGGPMYANNQTGMQGGVFTTTNEIGRGSGQDVGQYGWRVIDQEGGSRATQADANVVTPYGRADVAGAAYGIGRASAGVGTAEFAGSIVAMGGAIAAGPTTGDAFALVKTGASGVGVTQDNRDVGTTGLFGALLVPNLRPFQDNKIGIDPKSLPAQAVSNASEMIVRPKAASGVVADFGVVTNPRDAEFILVDVAGKPIPTGSTVQMRGRKQATVMGYDGRVYFSGLEAHGIIDVKRDAMTCSAAFDYAPRQRSVARPTIGPLVCR